MMIMPNVDILLTISNNDKMLLQAEVLRNSLVSNSNLNFNFHLVIIDFSRRSCL